MQGIERFIPTVDKIRLINQLLKVGFDTIDFGSFVSPKAVPQLVDTAEVLDQLDLTNTKSKLLAIVANERGGNEAIQYEKIAYIGFPLSISETFQKRNTNRSIKEGFKIVEQLQSLCENSRKQLVIYLSMGFGNPYGDPYDADLLSSFTQELSDMGVSIISVADTVGSAGAVEVKNVLSHLIEEFPSIEIGAHLHSYPEAANEKILATYEAGCRRLDGALLGFGGCPFAEDELVGNIDTEEIINTLPIIDMDSQALIESKKLAAEMYNR
jgi:hydroxymethylglutaryl-CoA lyase